MSKFINIAVIDKTGRGHAICESLLSNNENLYIHYIPGTGGVFSPRIKVVDDIIVEDAKAISYYCKNNKVELIFVSHIDALKNGVTDTLRENGFKVCGPSKSATLLESSKLFCKEICESENIRTPLSKEFNCLYELVDFLKNRGSVDYFVKADWLTRNGNGAFLVKPDEKLHVILEKVDLICSQNPDNPFKFIIEEYQNGVDFSAHYFLNTHSIIELPSSMDYKKSLEKDKGDNCDGMGSISPHPFDSSSIRNKIKENILKPLLSGLAKRGVTFNGPIYLGLRIDNQGAPVLIEVNARLGDSESEVIFPRINSDLSKLIYDIASEKGIRKSIIVNEKHCMTISLVTGSVTSDNNEKEDKSTFWPNSNVPTNEVVNYRPHLLKNDVRVYWANVKMKNESCIETTVGRIAHISALGQTLEEAAYSIYSSTDSVDFKSKRFRTDIGNFYFEVPSVA